MKSFTIATALAAAGIANATPTRSEPPTVAKRQSAPAVSASGNAFWAGDERFYIRGMDYQPGGEATSGDPLSDETICDRDIAEFVTLGINTIRVYIIDNTADHDYCMNKLAENGIYLALDVNTPKYSINRVNPHPSYNEVYLQSVFATVDAFAKYDNTLLFFSGNEVINDLEEEDTTLAAPYVKAVTRDVRNYIKARGYRSIPVGYSAADVSSNRMETAQYFNCGDDEARSDFFAFNDYSWCSSDYETAEWDKKVQNFTDYGLPLFLSEWGCNTNTRDFEELSALMDTDLMTSVYSGGLMYEYTMEDSNYGIVNVVSDEEVERLQPEFDNFKSALSAYPAPTGNGGAASTTHAVDCPTQGPSWNVDPSADLPTFPTGAQVYMDEGAGEGPGLKGAGSQEAGPELEDDESANTSDEDDDSAAGQIRPFLATGVFVGLVGLVTAFL